MTLPEPSLLDSRLDGILREALIESDRPALLVNPSSEAVAQMIRTVADDGGSTARILADRRMLKEAMDDFIVASTAADLVDRGHLELRTLSDDGPDNSLLVTPDSVVALVETGSSVGGLTTDNESFIEEAYDMFTDVFAESEPFSIRTPAISRVRESLGEDIGPQAEQDFNEVLASLETARGDGDGLDEVTISLLVAAKNEELLYDISRWGEDVGIASKATFSRTKTNLEEKGIIETEKVPIDVGRPRLRLKLGEKRLEDADGSQLASVAQSILA